MIRILLSLFIATSLFAQDTDGKKATKSVIVKDHWSKYINFYSNIGEEASNFEAILFSEILNFKNTQSLKKFSSADNTRFVLSAYELQHRDVVDFVREGLAKGFHFKIVVDGNLLEEFKPLSKAQLEKLTDHQRSFYYTSYDLNRDGIVDADDAAKYNKRYRVTKWCWSQLQQLQSENKRNLKLISSPYEVVPARENLNYPRIHHWKEYTVQFKIDDKWVDQKSFIPSSNLTNTCLNHEKGRISDSYANFLRYTRASEHDWEKALKEKQVTQKEYDKFLSATAEEKYQISFAKTKIDEKTGLPLPSGHVQFGMLFNESEIIEKFKTNPIKNWEEMYQKSLFFDEAKPRDKFLPEIIFDDSKTQSYSRLRAYFSEGNALNRADSDFVNTAYRSIFSDPGNSLRVFKTSQFVATHPRVIQKLTEAFSSSEFEEAFMVVDGHFSAENYSAFPYLILSRPNDQAFVPWTRAVDMNPLDLKRKEQIANSMFSFDGSEGIYGGREGVKLHAKVSYMEYVDSRGVRHYVVIHGSANLSVNAGKGNADGLIVFDTTDPSLKKIIDPYFEGLKNNPRTKPFVETYLQKRMAHLIKYNASASKELLEHGFESSRLPKIIEDNYKLLNINDGKLTHEFAKLLKGEMALDSERSFLIEVIETITKESNQSAYSKNVLKLLRYYSQLDTRLRLEQLEQMLYLANPQNHPYEGFIKRVKVEWLKRVNQNQKAELESLFDKVILEMARFQNGSESINLKPTVREIYNNCNIHFKNLGLSDYLRVKPKADK